MHLAIMHIQHPMLSLAVSKPMGFYLNVDTFYSYGQESPGWIFLFKIKLVTFFVVENIQQHQFFW